MPGARLHRPELPVRTMNKYEIGEIVVPNFGVFRDLSGNSWAMVFCAATETPCTIFPEAISTSPQRIDSPSGSFTICVNPALHHDTAAASKMSGRPQRAGVRLTVAAGPASAG